MTRRLTGLIPVVLATACATAPPPRTPPASPPPAGQPVVVALVDKAERASREGRHDLAASQLERALRIDRGNARLWHRLARVRLDQGALEQAEQLALKSISLAGSDPALQVSNWEMIAGVRDRQGRAEAADRARREAGRWRRGR